MINRETLTVWTIHWGPPGHPGEFVVILEVVELGKVHRLPEQWFAESLNHARKIIEFHDPSADACFARSPDDAPSVVESWL